MAGGSRVGPQEGELIGRQQFVCVWEAVARKRKLARYRESLRATGW
jgi:hypothetical protein